MAVLDLSVQSVHPCGGGDPVFAVSGVEPDGLRDHRRRDSYPRFAQDYWIPAATHENTRRKDRIVFGAVVGERTCTDSETSQLRITKRPRQPIEQSGLTDRVIPLKTHRLAVEIPKTVRQYLCISAIMGNTDHRHLRTRIQNPGNQRLKLTCHHWVK